MLDRLYRAAANANGERAGPDAAVAAALHDDLNTPLALSRLVAIDDPAVLAASAGLLGLLGQSADYWFHGESDDSAIIAAIDARNAARKASNFAEADRLRDALKTQDSGRAPH